MYAMNVVFDQLYCKFIFNWQYVMLAHLASSLRATYETEGAVSF